MMMKNSRYYLFIMLVFFLNVCGSNQSLFYWKCSNKNQCDLLARFKGHNEYVYKNWDKADIGNVAINFFPNGLSVISYSCGSPCSYETYVNFNTQQISETFFLVIATDYKKSLIALPDPDDEKDQTLEVRSIFDDKANSMKIKRAFSMGVSDSLEEAKFIGNKLSITYQTGGNQFIDKKEVIPINLIKN